MDFERLSDIMSYYQLYHLTKYKYESRKKALIYFDNLLLSNIKRCDIKKWAVVRQLDVSSATVNREISFARASINVVSRDYEISLNNPFCDVKYFEAERQPMYLTIDEYKLLLESALSAKR